VCGIAGWVSPDKGVDVDILKRMRDVLAHRGPDGKGIWRSTHNTVGLAHRRLAIIDRSDAANQPMIDKSARNIIVFNGEIYNHKELRAQLEVAGEVFMTDHSDTEVLLKGYSYWGLDELLRRVNGMFAFVIFDERLNSLFLVRDRVGIKPLYFTRTTAGLLFASEAKALLECPSVRPKLDKEAFWHFLAFRSLPAPMSLFDNIQKVAPGEYLRIDCANLNQRKTQYWDPIAAAASVPAGQQECADALEELLLDSIKLRMEADTDVGVFLSGGLDSTFILDAASKESGSLSTFTASYSAHPDYDEGPGAVRTAGALRTRHHNVDINDETYLGAIVDVAYYQDEPIAAPVCVPVYLLSQSASDSGVPVILAGEGSDELFIGYQNWIRIRNAQQFVNKVPASIAAFLGRSAFVASRQFESFVRPAELARRAALSQPLFWGGAMDFSETERQWIAGYSLSAPSTSTYKSVIEPFRSAFCDSRDSTDVTGWMTYIDMKFRLPELMLPRLDKMGMAFSVEGRVPFLDHRIVEFVMGLPPEYHTASGSVGKPLFKTVASRSLPGGMVNQRKRGFQAPVKEWKQTSFSKTYLQALVAFADRTGLLNPSSVESLLQRKSDRLYFSLVNFMLWYCIFVENVVDDFFGELRPRKDQ
jgi:asparagine synthase (glutamine-hydrolysing)